MNSPDAAVLRQVLLDLRDATVGEGAVEVKVEVETPVASASDEDEAPHREMDQTIASARNRERAERLVNIERALVRLAEDPDGYGRCEVCDEPIPARRLALLPFARQCVECQSARETRGPVGRKKVMDYR